MFTANRCWADIHVLHVQRVRPYRSGPGSTPACGLLLHVVPPSLFLLRPSDRQLKPAGVSMSEKGSLDSQSAALQLIPIEVHP